MTLLQPSEVPSRTGINNAITSEIAAHASTSNPSSPHYVGPWTTFTKVSPSASMANITLEYRITGKFIEWRTSGNTAADISVPVSGDIVNQNITSGIPANLRPEASNHLWVISLGSAAYLAVTPGGICTLLAVEGYGTATRTITSGTAIAGTSPAFRLP